MGVLPLHGPKEGARVVAGMVQVLSSVFYEPNGLPKKAGDAGTPERWGAVGAGMFAMVAAAC